MPNENRIPPSVAALQEALGLSSDILRNIELSELPLTTVALKVIRLARLLNDFDAQRMFEYESTGYPRDSHGVPSDVFSLAEVAGRGYSETDHNTKEDKRYIFTDSVEELEGSVQLIAPSLDAARDADISVSSANPHQTVAPPAGNKLERHQIRSNALRTRKHLASRRSLIYRYALSKHYELRFSGIADDVFSRVRERVDASIGAVVPQSVQTLTAIYENLQSENPEDWSNAVHGCRRLLQDLADALFPPQDDRIVSEGGNEKTIRLGHDNYVNRLIAFVQDRSNSLRYQEIVGSQLGFLGDRLDSVFRAAQKGSHNKILAREEADRYVVYTYLIVGDLLSLAAARVPPVTP